MKIAEVHGYREVDVSGVARSNIQLFALSIGFEESQRTSFKVTFAVYLNLRLVNLTEV